MILPIWRIFVKTVRDANRPKIRPLNIKIDIETWNWLESEASRRKIAGEPLASKTLLVTEAIGQLRQKLEGKKK